jgi:Holliday junction resolvase RusA-like endonuclease
LAGVMTSEAIPRACRSVLLNPESLFSNRRGLSQRHDTMIRLILPFPPSVNRYWRHVGQRTLISREGRLFRERVCASLAVRNLKPMAGDLALTIELHPPDRRRRDADNYFKATLDALEHARAYENDAQIVHLEIDKCDRVPGGQAIIRIEPHSEYLKRRTGLVHLVCCAGCGRDTYQKVDDRADPYCKRCISHSHTHAFPEHLDRKPLRLFDGDPRS